MKAPLLLSAGVTLGMAIGFVVWSGGGKLRDGDEAAAGRPTARQPSARTSARPSSGADEVLADFLKGRSPTDLTAEQAYELMRPLIRDPLVSSVSNQLDWTRMRYQVQLMASKLPPEVIEQTMDLARQNGTDRYMLGQWYAAFVSRDPERALDWASRQPDPREWRGMAIASMTGTNPELATKLFENEIRTGPSRLALQEIPVRLAQAAGKQGAAAVFKVVDSMPNESINYMINRAWHTLPEEEKPAFLAKIRKRADDGQSKYQACLTGLLLDRSESHSEELQEWMEQQTPEYRAQITMRLATKHFNSGNADKAKEYLAAAMTSTTGSQREFVNDHVYLYEGKPDLFAMMVDMLPQDQKPTLDDVRRWTGNGASQEMLEAATLISSPGERSAYAAEALDRLGSIPRGLLNAKDFEILSHRLDALELTGEAGEKARATLKIAREKALNSK